MAFKVAGSLAFKKAAEESGMKLLEPIMELEVITPGRFYGGHYGRPEQPPRAGCSEWTAKARTKLSRPWCPWQKF